VKQAGANQNENRTPRARGEGEAEERQVMTDKKITFTDAKGRTWTIEISDKALQHVADAGLEFKISPEVQINHPDALRRHQQIIFALIEPAAIRLGVSWGDFRAAMSSPELIADAWAALNNAIARRFPKRSAGRQDDDDTGNLHNQLK
jgi:hypothetical protein